VIAVEPGDRMPRGAGGAVGRRDVHPGRGEAIPLQDVSADAVFVSSAWHWLDPDLAVPEIARMLRDSGGLGILSTNMDRPIPWLRVCTSGSLVTRMRTRQPRVPSLSVPRLRATCAR
jgi:SAM-dependent methyltransferase